MNHRFTIVTLNELLVVAREGQRGFATCAEGVRCGKLKELLNGCALRYSACVAELGELIRQLGGDAHLRARMVGGARRGWLNLRAALALNDDAALLDECERSEGHVLEIYRNALDDHLPDCVRPVIQRQFEDVMNDQIHVMRGGALRSSPPAASVGGQARQ
jgi:uncharacterized protein (TIGR02284 family)